MRQAEAGVEIVGVDGNGNNQDMSVLDQNDIAYDPGQMTVDLTKGQKLRTTALMMAIQSYDKLIIKDADMYLAICREEGRKNPNFTIQPATMNAIVDAAVQFEMFIAGAFSPQLKSNERRKTMGEETQSPPAETPEEPIENNEAPEAPAAE
jgi:hypothetical protein